MKMPGATNHQRDNGKNALSLKVRQQAILPGGCLQELLVGGDEPGPFAAIMLHQQGMHQIKRAVAVMENYRCLEQHL